MMTRKFLETIGEQRRIALQIADRSHIRAQFPNSHPPMTREEKGQVQRLAFALEFAVHEMASSPARGSGECEAEIRQVAAESFHLWRTLPPRKDPLEYGLNLLRASALAIIGDCGFDAARWLQEPHVWPKLPLQSKNWGTRIWATVIDAWLRIMRKDGWGDLERVIENISTMRSQQEELELPYLKGCGRRYVMASARELGGLYHLANAAEAFAQFAMEGGADGDCQIQQLLGTHFDRALKACGPATLIDLEPAIRLLAATAKRMVTNSIWTVAREGNDKASHFVRTLVESGDRPLFDLLPAQRKALAEEGLMGANWRAAVVSLPASSGKTLIAEFRILQALEQFEAQEGWVAWLAPTSAWAHQIARQLRRDFAPLGIVVERLSAALEVDGVERQLLGETNGEHKFRVLVTTPEKLDLMIRQGWEEKIGRPLTLVIADEAHGIQSPGGRGLKLELLLATINRECRNAHFLLLAPFIPNAGEIARWLDPRSGKDVQLNLDQPNDRVVGIVEAEKGEQKKRKGGCDYQLTFSARHTTRKTLATDQPIRLPNNEAIAASFARANKPGTIAAIAAQHLKERGPVILMHARPDWVWSLAEELKIAANRHQSGVSEDVALVQDYVRRELGESFPLVDLLSFGIGVHHSGLPQEIRQLVEWLFENSQLDFLVATTNIAHGINFPVSSVVMASHQYFGTGYARDMSAADFWNMAGRGTHGQMGVVALASDSPEKTRQLQQFVDRSTGDLNSALTAMVQKAASGLDNLSGLVCRDPQWSGLLQYLAHSYRQMGCPEDFEQQIEQILRDTLGFEKLRAQDSKGARKLLAGIRTYWHKVLHQPDAPLDLMDSTGFSPEGVKAVLSSKGSLNERSWDSATLFAHGDSTLATMIGVLRKVPDLQHDLATAFSNDETEADQLAGLLKDWVAGETIPQIARKYFREDDELTALTRCGQSLFGNLTRTASWGLGAMLAITAGDKLSEEDFQRLSNLPSRIYYGVNTDEAISLRLLGVPRSAAAPVAEYLGPKLNEPLPKVRATLSSLNASDWRKALGGDGPLYRRVWQILEGTED